MSTYKIDLQEAFRNQFHINVNTATTAVIDRVLNDFTGIEVKPTDNPLSLMSRQGIPVWDYLKISPKIIAGTGEDYEGFEFPAEIVVEASLTKKVVETEIFGADGNVEELIGLSDWDITIRGFIINYQTTDYPENEVKELKRLCELKDVELEVEGTFLNLLDIGYISIHSLTLPPAVGYSDMQAFEITAKSKIPFTLRESDGVLL